MVKSNTSSTSGRTALSNASCQLEHFVQFVGVDAFIPASVGDLCHLVEDGTSDEAFEYLDEAVLCSHDCLVGNVLTFGFPFGFLTRHDDRFHCFRAEQFRCLLGRCVCYHCALLCLRDQRVRGDHLGGRDAVDGVVLGVQEIGHR